MSERLDTPMGDRELEALRRHGFGVAYRMLGSVSEAEDVAQEALLRLTRQEGPIDEPAAWMTTVVDAALDQRPEVGAGPSRVVCRAVAAGAARRGPGARPGLARRARGFAVAGPAGAVGAADPGRARRLPSARGVRLRVRGDRRHHRAHRGELATARDAGAEASRGQPPALRRRRGCARRVARTVPRGRRGGRPGGSGGAARQGCRPVRRQRRQGDGAAGAALRRRAHRALHGRRGSRAARVRRVREPAGEGQRPTRPPGTRPGRAAVRRGRAARGRAGAGAHAGR